MGLQTLFGNKVDIAIERLRQFEPPEGYYLAFSGGKDSVVILDLAKKAGVKYDAHYNFTTVDPPELVEFIKTYSEVEISKPTISMWQLIVKKRMPPTRVVRYCCEHLKERGGSGRIVITGVRKEESSKRKKYGVVIQCRNDIYKKLVNPIVDWTEEDVWEYIRDNGVSYCGLYDKGFKRLGCVMCPLSSKSQMVKESIFWPKYKRAYILAFKRMIDKRKQDGMETEWETGEEVFDWWINGGEEDKGNEDQGRFFFE